MLRVCVSLNIVVKVISKLVKITKVNFKIYKTSLLRFVWFIDSILEGLDQVAYLY